MYQVISVSRFVKVDELDSRMEEEETWMATARRNLLLVEKTSAE